MIVPSLRIASAPMRPDTAWKVLVVRPTWTIGLGPWRSPGAAAAGAAGAVAGDARRLGGRRGAQRCRLVERQGLVAGQQPAPVVRVAELVERRLVVAGLVLALRGEQDRGVVARGALWAGRRNGGEEAGADHRQHRRGANETETGRYRHDYP